MEVFLCPSSPADNPNAPSLAYAGNMGIGVYFNVNALPAPKTDQSKFDSVMTDTIGKLGSGSYNGIRMSLDQVSSGDGTSTTALFSEKNGAAYSPQASYDITPAYATTATAPTYLGSFAPASWAVQQAYPLPVFGIPVSPVSAATPPTITGVMINSPNANIDGNHARPSSNHPGGVLTTFCDGHTVFVKDSITASVYCHLLTPNTMGTLGGSTAGGATSAAVGSQFLYNTPLSESDFN
jgi:hypothetical protein